MMPVRPPPYPIRQASRGSAPPYAVPLHASSGWRSAGIILAVVLVVSITTVGAWAVMRVECLDCCVDCWQPPTYMSWYVRATDGNWTIESVHAPPGMLPASTFLQVRDASGVTSLERTPFSDLSEANWASLRALYLDANPGDPGIRPGDSLVLERAAFPEGSTFTISATGQMATGILG